MTVYRFCRMASSTDSKYGKGACALLDDLASVRTVSNQSSVDNFIKLVQNGFFHNGKLPQSQLSLVLRLKALELHTLAENAEQGKYENNLATGKSKT